MYTDASSRPMHLLSSMFTARWSRTVTHRYWMEVCRWRMSLKTCDKTLGSYSRERQQTLTQYITQSTQHWEVHTAMWFKKHHLLHSHPGELCSYYCPVKTPQEVLTHSLKLDLLQNPSGISVEIDILLHAWHINYNTFMRCSRSLVSGGRGGDTSESLITLARKLRAICERKKTAGSWRYNWYSDNRTLWISSSEDCT